MKQRPIIIVGQGLAGSILSYHCVEGGYPVIRVDNGPIINASLVAGGILDMMSGPRCKRAWRSEQTYPAARHFYESLEKRFKTLLFTPINTYRFFQTKRDKDKWFTDRNQTDLEALASKELITIEGINADLGGYEVKGTGIINIPHLLTVLNRYLKDKTIYEETYFNASDITVTNRDVIWKTIKASKVIFCEGYKVSQNPYFSWLPFQHAKGNVLTLHSKDIPNSHIIYKGKWLFPLGDNLFKFGATYDWDQLDEIPDQSAKESLCNDFEELFPNSDYHVVEHKAAVRPIVQDARPLVGWHHQSPHIGIFNGFGSKSVLNIPYYADKLVSHLKGDPFNDPFVSPNRYLKRYGTIVS